VSEQRSTGDVLLRVENMHTFYGTIEALKGISIDVREGEIVTLIGANGAGKSTTLRSINGLNQPREGSITFRGQDITRRPPHEIVGLGISQSPEGRRLFPHMSVIENLEMGAFQRTTASRSARTSTGSTASSRASPSARTSGPGRCPAASSRCARSAGR
jgi:branched-chain amino acid transport system ATP-binding protein